jgi:hypothetical protein
MPDNLAGQPNHKDFNKNDGRKNKIEFRRLAKRIHCRNPAVGKAANWEKRETKRYALSFYVE